MFEAEVLSAGAVYPTHGSGISAQVSVMGIQLLTYTIFYTIYSFTMMLALEQRTQQSHQVSLTASCIDFPLEKNKHGFEPRETVSVDVSIGKVSENTARQAYPDLPFMTGWVLPQPSPTPPLSPPPSKHLSLSLSCVCVCVCLLIAACLSVPSLLSLILLL